MEICYIFLLFLFVNLKFTLLDFHFLRNIQFLLFLIIELFLNQSNIRHQDFDFPFLIQKQISVVSYIVQKHIESIANAFFSLVLNNQPESLYYSLKNHMYFVVFFKFTIERRILIRGSRILTKIFRNQLIKSLFDNMPHILLFDV